MKRRRRWKPCHLEDSFLVERPVLQESLDQGVQRIAIINSLAKTPSGRFSQQLIDVVSLRQSDTTTR